MLNNEVCQVQKLKAAIADQDILTASLLVASQFSQGFCAQDYINRVEQFAQSIEGLLDVQLTTEQRFRQFVSYFYTELAFSGNDKDFFASKYSLLNEVIDYRTGIPVTLSILFCCIAKSLGFEVHGVNFPGHFILRFQASKEKALFIDPLNGKFLSWRELEQLYFNILGEIDEEEMPEDALFAAKTEEIVVRLLNNLKAAFIKEEKFHQALVTVEWLVELCPDDPYERRDRGFLLHQLDCPRVAIPDYKFFIEKCPQDPAAQLLKLQLRNFSHEPPQILH